MLEMLEMLENGLRTLREGPETPTEWKYESVSDRPTYQQG